MTPGEKRQTITLAIGGASAMLVAFVGLLVAEVPTHLRSLVSNGTAWAIAITCTLPILIVLAANQISILLKASTDREDTVQEIAKFIPRASLIIHFDTSAAAMEYLAQNIPRAKHILNMRVVKRKIEESDPENLRVTAQLDAAVWAAMQNGTNYEWIVSQEYEHQAVDLQAKRSSYSVNHKATGMCTCWTLTHSEIPYFQFSILEYLDHKELLLGWALTSSRSFADRVFLIRDERFVSYFKGLFETYARLAHPVT